MAKEYVVESAMISCEYGSTPIELKTPDHRHIYADEKKLSNITDIDSSCIECFGSCSSPYLVSYNVPTMELFAIDTVQEARKFLGDSSCISEVVIPWQNPKPDVYAGHYQALIEGCWTVCQKGFGIISVIASGQSAESNNQLVMQKLKELEQAVEAYMKEHGIKSKYKDKLLESILLWDDYDQTFWERTSDEHTTGFSEYLRKDNPALFNFFERNITIQDTATGKDVDLTYFMGLMKGFEKDHTDPLEAISPEITKNESMLNAYLDAANLNQVHYDDIKDKSLVEIIDGYYGLSGTPSGKTQKRYRDFVDTVTPLLDNPYLGVVVAYEQATDEEKKFIRLNDMISGRLQHGTDEEYASELTTSFLGKVRQGLSEERGR
ncbi:PAAR-like protein [Paenibacillus lautus]|uniref:PAAR-like protein n=1 Tax=Paenibacillus lautus TaxID=1401 RepID=UPI003D2CC570